MADQPLLEVGRTGRAHGVRGTLYVDLVTDRVERVAPGSRLLVGDVWMTVATSQPAAQRWLVHFEGVDDRAAAERLVGVSIRAEFVKTSARSDDLWVHEMIGRHVVDADGVDRGRCVAVVANPAHDLLELQDGHLVPVAFVTAFDGDVIRVRAPSGLFDELE